MGVWGLGIGDWGLEIGPNPQSPIPIPQSPIPKKNKNIIFYIYFDKLIKLIIIFFNLIILLKN